MAAAQGWYPDPSNPEIEWFWDGASYTVSRPASRGGPIRRFTSTIDGQRTEVEVLEDRIDWTWSQSKGVSGGKIAAGILTAGMSLAVTGVGKGGYGVKKDRGGGSIRLDTINGIATRQSGKETIIAVTTGGVAVDMVVSTREAPQILALLHELIAKAKRVNVEAPSVVVNVASGPSDQASVQAAQLAALSSPDIMANLERLGDMRYKRLISDEEFNQMKAKLLSS